MRTLRQNLQDALLFALMDAKMPQQDAHKYSSEISEKMSEWVRNYFVWYVKHEKKAYQNQETRKAFEKLIEHISLK